MLIFCFAQKNIAAKLELLSIDSKTTIDSPIKQALSLSQIYHIHLTIISELCQRLNSYWPLLCNNLITIDTLQKELFSDAALTKIIVKNLPAKLQLNSLSAMLKITAAAKQLTELYQLIDADIYIAMPTLCEKYQKIIKQYNNNSLQLPEQFLQELASVALALENKRHELETCEFKKFAGDERTKVMQKVIHLFTLKLLTIQQELFTLNAWAKNYTQYPAKIPVWTKYQEIMLDQQLKDLSNDDPLFSTYLTNYNKIMTNFFTTPKPSITFLYTLLVTTAQFRSILSHNEQSFINSLFKHPDASTSILKKMAQTLNDIASYLQQTTNKNDGIAHTILNEQCKSDSQNPKKGDSDGSLWDGAQQLVNDNMQPIKKAVLYLFTHVSPYIATILISWMFPKFSQEIKSKFSQFFAQQATTPDDQKAQHLGDFISNNPDILSQLCRLNPDLISSLAKQPAEYETNTEQ